MPEMGLPTHLMFQLLFGLDVPAFKQTDEDGGNDAMSVMRGNQFRALKYSLDVQNAICDKVLNAIRPLADQGPPFYLAVAARIQEPTKNRNTGKSLDELDPRLYRTFKPLGKEDNRKCFDFFNRLLAKHSPFISFMQENKTEIRARRGVRIALLGHLAEGSLAKRLRRSSAVFLADVEHHDHLGEDCEYGAYGARAWDLDSLCKEKYARDYWKRRVGKSTKDAFTNIYTTGMLFDGGGLVPHFNEIPFQLKKRETKLRRVAVMIDAMTPAAEEAIARKSRKK
jgi:hypothetical protein